MPPVWVSHFNVFIDGLRSASSISRVSQVCTSSAADGSGQTDENRTEKKDRAVRAFFRRNRTTSCGIGGIRRWDKQSLVGSRAAL
jgi:hypothetical protein